MTIYPEALEKARSLVANYGSDPDGLLVGAIAAALQAAHDAAAPKLPDDLAGLVKELRDAAALKKEAADVVRPFAEQSRRFDEAAALRKALVEARVVVDAVAGHNQPDRQWSRQVRDRIDAALTSTKETGDAG